ncbi:MAG: polysulfide reductase NrfD [Lentimicrobium sp.]|jgi:formate-dependent nitrite reductase membrane component NrfD|nr:polysulfide reductase NrfD [Lentimicrobium sp.]
MKEEIFISGRNIPHIDPHLSLWEFPISFYLFLGGLSAGILLFSAITHLLNKDEELKGASKWAPLIVPFALAIGLLALIIDLGNPFYSWKLYTTIRLESPMSWGAWVLLIVTPLSILWVFSDLRKLFPKLNYTKLPILFKLEDLCVKYKKYIALALIPLTIVLGIYTGILLSAFNARPLWNNAILGPLFLVSGLSTAAATIILFAKSTHERHLFSKIDILLIVIEVGLIIHLIMGYYAGNEMQVEAVKILVGGDLTTLFFGFFVALGLLLPLVLEVFELMGYKVPVVVPAILIIVSGLIFRVLMVEAGQITRILY